MDLFPLGVMLVFLIVVNIVSFLLIEEDKKRAERGQWRIPEAVLLGFALLGGSIGGELAMVLHRHKTRKITFLVKYFTFSIPSLYMLYRLSQ